MYQPDEPELLDPYVAQALRDRYAAAVTRAWRIMMFAGLTSVLLYLYFVFVASVFRVRPEMLVNVSFGGLVLATVIAGFAVADEVRGKWPAAAALVCVGPLAYRAATVTGDHTWSSLIFVGGVVVMIATAIITLVFPRPEPPPALQG